MEQHHSPWMTNEYIETLKTSLAVLDYSIDNIDYVQKRGVPFSQAYFVPIHPCRQLFDNEVIERDIDVLFYGAISSERRRHYIEALSNEFKIRIETELFGD